MVGVLRSLKGAMRQVGFGSLAYLQVGPSEYVVHWAVWQSGNLSI